VVLCIQSPRGTASPFDPKAQAPAPLRIEVNVVAGVLPAKKVSVDGNHIYMLALPGARGKF
jgi:hypothetical protein